MSKRRTADDFVRDMKAKQQHSTPPATSRAKPAKAKAKAVPLTPDGLPLTPKQAGTGRWSG